MKKLRLAALVLCLSLLFSLCPARAETKPTLNSMAELRDYLDRKTIMLSEKIEFYWPESLSSKISKSDLRTMLHNYGVWECEINRAVLDVVVTDIEYFPGFRAANAFTTVGEHVLTSREKQLLNRAHQIVNQQAKYSPSPGDLAMKLHDYLCLNVKYAYGYGRDDDQSNAFGALLLGEAECDGYADAYYLLCRIAGIPVYYQGGDDLNLDDDSTHLWNIVNLNGVWYHVDVTWDDLDASKAKEALTYRNYAVGNDLMKHTHTWNQAMSVASITNHTGWDYDHVYTQNVVGVGAYCLNLNDAAAYAYECKKAGYRMAHIMMPSSFNSVEALHNAMNKASVKGRWTTWDDTIGEYIFFDIYFHK